MSDFDLRLRELYLDKSECVVNLPQWLLSSEKIDQYRAMSRLAIVEIAGRDSVAAAVRSVEEESFTDLLPTYVYTGTEYGPWTSVGEAVDRLANRLPQVRVHDLVVLGSPGFWQALNGRFITELISRYDFYTPCVGCHVYLHSIRIPLSLTLDKIPPPPCPPPSRGRVWEGVKKGNSYTIKIPIISGEREWHGKSAKINQTNEALNVYQGIAKHFGVQLLLPLRHIAEGDRIAEILGFEWQEGKEQLGCVLSKNYRLLDGGTCGTASQIQRYLEEFASPCAKEIIKSYTVGHVPNHLDVAAQVLGSPGISPSTKLKG